MSPWNCIQKPAMMSHGAMPEPNCAAGTIAWRSFMAGSPLWSWSAWPTSWAMTAAAATLSRCWVVVMPAVSRAVASATWLLTRSILPRGS